MLVAVVCQVVAYAELVASRGGSVDAVLLGASHLPPAAFAGLLVLLVANVVLRRLADRFQFSPAEMILLYFMMVVAALLSSFGMASQLLPNMVALNYFSTPANEWEKFFFNSVPQFLVPWDTSGPANQPVARSFYEGARGAHGVPWGLWIGPLIWWSLLGSSLFLMMAGLATLVRRQWSENERLSFPLVQLPLEMANSKKGGLFANRLMWLGFTLPVALHVLNGLNHNFPQVPMVQVHWVLNQYWTQKPWSDLVYTPIVIALSVVGLSYLLPLDVSFSMWFFLLFFRAQDYIASVMGIQPVNAALYPARYHIGYQSAGAFFVIVLSLMWMARPHFRDVWNRIKNPSLDKDNGEMMSYRTAFSFAIFGMLGAIAWCWNAGVGLAASVVTIVVFAIIVIVLTRCVAEIGLILLQPIFRPVDVFAIGASPAVIGPAGLAVLALVNGTFIRDPRTLMPAMLDGMKASGSIGLNRRSLGKAFLIAIPAAIFFSLVFQLNIIYGTGGLSLNRWFFQDNPQMYFTEAKSWLVTNPAVNPAAGAWFGVGAITTVGLFIMRTQFWWWPFHPLGYAMGAAWPAIIFWFAFFCGWLAKTLLLRYGGAKAYVGARPFFLGLILGEFTIAIFWALMAGLFGMRAPSIPIS